MPTPEPTVLIAAANPALRQRLLEAFLCDGHDVEAVDSRDGALERITAGPLDLIVLAELDGPAASTLLLQTIRAQQSSVSVVAIARGPSELDRVRPLEAGADAVVASECSYYELRAHVRALHQRHAPRRTPTLRFGAVEIMPDARRLIVYGDDVDLAAREFELLVALAADPDRVFTKEELLRSVWGYLAMNRSRTLDSHACRLRRKLEHAGARHFIANVWGVGYRLYNPLTCAMAA